MELPNRKLQRLRNYDYSKNGAYFITICTENRLHLFGTINNGNVHLNEAGKIVEEKLFNLSLNDGLCIDKYIIMPNHIHAIILISHDDNSGTTQGSFPTISDYIKSFKTITTKLYIDGVKHGTFPDFNKRIWQKSFYDHIIQNEKEYLDIWKYIDENPLKWELDEYCNPVKL